MNKQEAIKTVEQDKIQVCRFTEITREVNAIQRKIEMVDYVPLETVLNIFDKISETEKVTVPKFVADLYESIKDDFQCKVYNLCLQFNKDNGELSEDVWWWFEFAENEPIQTLVKMRLFGYEVEREKLYTVEIPNPNSKGNHKIYLCKDDTTGKVYLCKGTFNPKKNKNLKLTEAEIKKDFEWAFQWAKEVE